METGTDNWFDIEDLLRDLQRDKVAEVRAGLVNQHKPVTADRVVSRLTFGFWTSLLNRPFEERLWLTGSPILLVKAFPYLPKRKQTRQAVHGRTQLANTLRNRVFHFEPIRNRPNLQPDYGHIREALGWTRPEMVQMIDFYNRFDSVHTQGFMYNHTEINIHLGD